tara:strand:+ start:222 stop:914 length:693 start_codon:yes stop_codon:yes gene_type:complete
MFVLSQQLQDLKKEITNKTIIFSEKEAERAIKESLNIGIDNGISILSKQDGYLKNKNVQIPFPEEAKVIAKKLKKMGLKKQVDNVVLSINRAAEDAAVSAKPIFVNAIKNMPITDAVSVAKDTGASGTNYLRTNTNDSLMVAFRPIIKNSLNKVNATKYWKNIIQTYNQIPFVDKMNPNLDDYVTQKAVEGLFFMIAKEEISIKQDIKKRTSDLLRKVFDEQQLHIPFQD